MESDLYKIQQQNFLTILTYYNKTKEKAENYYFFIDNYKQYTKEYLSKIKNIFSVYSPSLYEEAYNLDEEEMNDDNLEDSEEDDLNTNKSIFDLDISPNDNKNQNKIIISSINNNNSFIKNGTLNTNNIKVDLSPIFKLTNVIFKQIKNQINGLNSFLKGIDASTKNFKKIVDNSKKDINDLKNNYLEIKQDLFQNISTYKKNNDELLNCYVKIEDKITQFSFLKNNEEIYKNNKNVLNIDIQNIENDLNLKIIDLKKKENEFLQKENEKNNYAINFEKKSEISLQGIKDNTLLIIKNLQESIEKFLSYFINCYYMNYKDLSGEIKNIQEMKSDVEYEKIIKQDLKDINDEIIADFKKKYNPIQYNINILNNKKINQKLYEKLIKNGYDVKPENLELNENDIYFVVKKMYNFSLVNKENYDIEKEKKKLFIINILNLMLIIKKDQKKYIDNNPKLSEEKLSKLYTLLTSDIDYRIAFLEKLGNKRAEAVLEFSNHSYDIITKIFLIITDTLLKEKNNDIIIQILILSQTFYKVENNEKIYICHNICKHEIFQKDDFWIDYLKEIIIKEIEKRERNEKNIGKELDENDIITRNNEIVFAQLITMSECMKNFELTTEKIINLITPIFDIYKITQDTKDSILNYINRK